MRESSDINLCVCSPLLSRRVPKGAQLSPLPPVLRQGA
jgi:hypothetical protein